MRTITQRLSMQIADIPFPVEIILPVILFIGTLTNLVQVIAFVNVGKIKS